MDKKDMSMYLAEHGHEPDRRPFSKAVLDALLEIYDGDRMSDALHHYVPDDDEDINIMSVNMEGIAKSNDISQDKDLANTLDKFVLSGFFKEWEIDDNEVYVYDVNRTLFDMLLQYADETREMFLLYKAEANANHTSIKKDTKTKHILR